jgi:hypothetical protein
VHTESECVELKYQMFSPGKNVFDPQPGQPLDADFAVAGDAFDAPAGKRL